MSAGGKLGWGLVLLIAVFHYDFWLWDDTTLVFGFIPSSLAYHAGISLLAALAWTIVVTCAWPDEIEAWASQAPTSDSTREERP